MRGRTKAISLAAMLLIIFTSSMVFASGVLDPSKISLLGYTPIYPNAGEALFTQPVNIIKDYVNDPGYQIGNTFDMHVNVSSVTDLFAYGINVTWNPSILSYSGVAYGDFLLRTGSPYGTSRIQPTVKYDNTVGYASIAETILGNVAGISGGGRLFTIHFAIVGYGATRIYVNGAGLLPSTLLNSAGSSIAFTAAAGYFDNRISGDITGPESPPGSGKYPPDKSVDGRDLIKLGANFGTSDPVSDFTGPESPPGSGTYPPDGTVDGRDLIKLGANFGRHYP